MAWDPKKAYDLLYATAQEWSRDADRLVDNLEDYSSSEEEFVAGLSQGLGLDHDEIINQVAAITGEPPDHVAGRWDDRL